MFLFIWIQQSCWIFVGYFIHPQLVMHRLIHHIKWENINLTREGRRSTSVIKIGMQKILVILRLYWNPITLVLIWKVLRQAFRSYHYFWNPSTFGGVISLF
jgi:hypothetical protein